MDRPFSAEQSYSTVISEEENTAAKLIDGTAKFAAGGTGRFGMRRSASEWAFQEFLKQHMPHDVDGKTDNSPSSDGESKGTRKPSVKDPADSDVVDGDANSVSEAISPLFTGLGDGLGKSGVPSNTQEYQSVLTQKLNLACAAVALTRVTGVSSMDCGSPAVDTNQSQKCNFGSDDRAATLLSQSSGTCSGTIYNGPLGSSTSGPIGIPELPPKPKGEGGQARTTTSGSSREQSDEDDLEAGPSEESNDPSDLKRMRRMLSNRESARRSRRRKQAHLTDLEMQVSQLRVENSSLFKRFTDINQKYNDAAVDNRVLKSDVEALRAKVKMAEDMVSRAAAAAPIGHPLQNTSQVQSASSLRYTGGPFDLPTTGLVQGEEGLYMHSGQYTNNQSSSLHHAVSGIKQQNKEPQLQSTGTKMGRTPSMQRVASLEHLQKRMRGGTTCGSMSWGAL